MFFFSLFSKLQTKKKNQQIIKLLLVVKIFFLSVFGSIVFQNHLSVKNSNGSMPEWLIGADCKSAGAAYAGSNPARPNLKNNLANFFKKVRKFKKTNLKNQIFF